ncbi:MAG: DUF692 domain-containing protein [Bryobacteraceae bacterium]
MENVGIGFRRELEQGIFDYQSSFDCLEIIAESYFEPTRTAIEELFRLKNTFRLVPHGLRLSIGAVERPRQSYLDELARLLDRIDAPYHGDHFALTGANGIELGHLSPLWYTDEGLDTVISNIRGAQRFLGRQLVLETITHPFLIPGATMSPAEFIAAACRETGCGVLLDVTNVYINARNAGEDPSVFIRALPLKSVRQIHLVGYAREADGTYVDGHDQAIQDDLWALYDYTMTLCSPEFVIIERDGNFPDVAELAAETERARRPARERRRREAQSH